MLTVIGIDPAFANMGLCRAGINLNVSQGLKPLEIQELKLISTEGQDRKVVRKSSDDLRRAQELHAGLVEFCSPSYHPSSFPRIAFAEIPSGAQSAAAAKALGIAVGVLAACPIPIIQVNPLQVKLFTAGKKATKDDMIAWAVGLYPDADWLRHGKEGRITKANEHLADAIAIIHAGIHTTEFKQLVAMLPKSTSIKRVKAI